MAEKTIKTQARVFDFSGEAWTLPPGSKLVDQVITDWRASFRNHVVPLDLIINPDDGVDGGPEDSEYVEEFEQMLDYGDMDADTLGRLVEFLRLRERVRAREALR